jgi:hypothetical protein
MRCRPLSLLALLAIAPRLAAAEPAPSSAEALYASGAARLAVASFDDAASDFEAFARQAPADARAPSALAEATRLRLSLGDPDRAVSDAAELWRAAGRETPALAAGVTLAVARDCAGASAWAATRATLLPAMTVIDRRAALELRAQAHGLLSRAAAGLGSATEAAAEHRRVLAIAAKAERLETQAWGEGARDAAGEARMYFAEGKALAVERIALPPYPGVSSREAVIAYVNKVAAPWLARRMSALAEAERAYGRVLGVELPPPPRFGGGDPDALMMLEQLAPGGSADRYSARLRIAALARVGSMWADTLRLLRSVPLPKQTAQEAARGFEALRAMYYQMLDSGQDPLRRRAEGAFRECLRLSSLHRIVDEHTRVCEAWLVEHARAEYGASRDEIGPGAGWMGPAVVPAPATRGAGL